MLTLYLCFSFWHGGRTGADPRDSHSSRGRFHSPCHSYLVLLNHWEVTELYQIISKICEQPSVYSRALHLTKHTCEKKESGQILLWWWNLNVSRTTRTSSLCLQVLEYGSNQILDKNSVRTVNDKILLNKLVLSFSFTIVKLYHKRDFAWGKNNSTEMEKFI